MVFSLNEISKREGKVCKDGSGYKVYIRPEEAEKIGVNPGDSVDVTVNPDGSIILRASPPPNLYEKFLNNAIQGGVEFGEPIEIGDAHIIPIMSKDDDFPERNYVTVPEALAMGNLRFTDTGGISGVHVTNQGSLGVLIVQGQVFEGSTQPRTIVTNMILAPNQDIVLPARCVHSSHPITPNAKMTIAGMAPRTMCFNLMQPSNKVDQHRVWGEVNCIMGTTVKMPEIFARNNVQLNTSRWADTSDLTTAIHSLGNVASFAAGQVDKNVDKKKVKTWVSKSA